MKLYVICEETWDGDENHRYFLTREKALIELSKIKDFCATEGWEDYWVIKDVETED